MTGLWTYSNSSSTLATVVYGSPNATKRKALWSNLRHLASSIRQPWVLLGDFNATIFAEDRVSTSFMKPCKLFQEFIYDFGLRNMGFNGPEFTWKRGFAQARLDRFLCNSY
ncbi:hypothetical protein V6N13_059616 [Hibiscus sabdariffa]